MIGLILIFFCFVIFGHWLACEDKLDKPVDVAIFFGALRPFRFENRVKKTLDLYQRGMIKKIIVTGGLNRRRQKIEAPIIQKRLIKEGVDKSDIIIEDKATNFKENAHFSIPILKKIKAKSVALISSSFEQRRCFLTFKKAAKNLKIKIINQPASSEPAWNRNIWFLSPGGWYWTWRTVSKLIRYRLKGDL